MEVKYIYRLLLLSFTKNDTHKKGYDLNKFLQRNTKCNMH